MAVVTLLMLAGLAAGEALWPERSLEVSLDPMGNLFHPGHLWVVVVLVVWALAVAAVSVLLGSDHADDQTEDEPADEELAGRS